MRTRKLIASMALFSMTMIQSNSHLLMAVHRELAPTAQASAAGCHEVLVYAQDTASNTQDDTAQFWDRNGNLLYTQPQIDDDAIVLFQNVTVNAGNNEYIKQVRYVGHGHAIFLAKALNKHGNVTKALKYGNQTTTTSLPTDTTKIKWHKLTPLSEYAELYATFCEEEGNPTLTIQKSVSDANPEIGDKINFRFDVAKVGNGTAKNVVIKDTYPAGLRFVRSTGRNCTDHNRTVTCEPFDLTNADDSDQIWLEMLVEDEHLCLEPAENTGSIQADGIAKVQSNTVVFTTDCGTPELEITKSVSKANAEIGDQINFRFDIQKVGNGSAKNIVVKDTYPAGLKFVRSTGRHCTDHNGTVTCEAFTLPNGEDFDQIWLEMIVESEDLCDETVRNTATIQSDGTGVVNSNTVDLSVACRTPRYEIEKTGPTTVTAGENITYEFTVKNVGDAVGKGVRIIDTYKDGNNRIPMPFTYLSAQGAQCTYFPVDHYIQCELPDINPGNEYKFSMTFSTPENSHCGQNILNQVDVSSTPWIDGIAGWDKHMVNVNCVQHECSDGIDNDNDGKIDFPNDPGCTDEEDDDESDIKPEITILKDGPNTIEPGEDVTYTFTLTNSGDNESKGTKIYELNMANTLGFTFLPAKSDPSCELIEANKRVICGPFDIPGNSNKIVEVTGRAPENLVCGSTVTNKADTHSTYGTSDWAMHTADVVCVPDPECSDGIDNDNDGRVDFPDDAGCTDEDDDNEEDSADLKIVKTIKKVFNPDGSLHTPNTTVEKGGRVQYKVGLWNMGPGHADNVVTKDTIPAGMTFVPSTDPTTPASSPECSQIGNEVVCVFGTVLNVNRDRHFRIVFDTDEATCDADIINTARVESTTDDPVPGNNSSDAPSIRVECTSECSDGIDNDNDGDIDFPADAGCTDEDDDNEGDDPELTIEKAGPAEAKPGSDVTYTLTVTNTGDSTSVRTKVRDFIPQYFSFDAGQSDNDCFLLDANTVECGESDLAAGAQKIYEITFNIAPAAKCDWVAVNTAKTWSQNVDNVFSNEVATVMKCDPKPVCSDGIDNDNDGFTDFPDDIGCLNKDDTDEEGETLCITPNRSYNLFFNALPSDEDGNLEKMVVFADEGGVYQETGARTATISGDLIHTIDDTSGFTLHLNLSGRLNPGDAGYPTPGGTTIYYETFEGTAVGFGAFEGAVMEIESKPMPLQLNKDPNGPNYTIKGWYTTKTVSQPTTGPEFEINGGGDIHINTMRECLNENPAECGDGEVNQPSEQCDDGNNNDNDGCNNSCRIVKPVISMVKEGPDTIHPGDEVTYTFRVTNESANDSIGTKVYELLLANTLGFTYVPEKSDPACELIEANKRIICGPYDIPGNSEKLVEVTGIAPETLACDTQVTNKADVHSVFGTSDWAMHTANAVCKTECNDGVDNDNDGRTDFPEDLGCTSADDDDESDDPECSDGVDNDNDGLVDFPQDPGCESPSDDDESDGTSECQDGIDNDGDGEIDFPNDPGCDSPQDDDEFNEPLDADLSIAKSGVLFTEKGNTILYTLSAFNAGPGKATDVLVKDAVPEGTVFNSDASDTGCVLSGTDVVCENFSLDADESKTFVIAVDVLPTAECGGDIENTATIESPAKDPNTGNNTSETVVTNVRCTVCSDGIDNDNDGRIDFPEDLGCADANDDDETDTADLKTLKFVNNIYTADGVLTGSKDVVERGGRVQYRIGIWNMGPHHADDVVIRDVIPEGMTFVPSTDPETPRSNQHCAQEGNEVVCTLAQPILNTNRDRALYVVFDTNTATCDETIVNTASVETSSIDNVPGNNTANAPAVRVECTNLPPQCSDGIDNDNDGHIDFPADAGCDSADDDNEYNPIDHCTDEETSELLFGTEFKVNITEPDSAGLQNDTFKCPAGSVVTSIGYKDSPEDSISSDGLDGITIACSPLNADGTLGAEGAMLPNADLDGNPRGLAVLRCPAGKVATRLYNKDSDGALSDLLDGVSIGCATMTENGILGDEEIVDGNGDLVNSRALNSNICAGNAVMTGLSYNTFADAQLADYTDHPTAIWCLPLDVECTAKSECSDGIDNDNDGHIDFPADAGCESPEDDDETDEGPIVSIVKNGPAVIHPNSEVEYTFTITNNGNIPYEDLRIVDLSFVTNGMTIVTDKTDPECVVGANGTAIACGLYTLQPDESKTVTLTGLAPNYACDQADIQNKADVQFKNLQSAHWAMHTADVQCIPECQDGIDNDNDGLADYPADPGCESPNDDDESDGTTECQDGIDNDNDGLVDFPADPGCESPQDDDEFNEPLDADLSIVKSGVLQAVRGEKIGYTLSAFNAGPGKATDVVLSDVVPAGLTFNADDSDDNCHLSGGTVLCDAFTIEQNDSKTFVIAFDVASTVTCYESIDNIATISGSNEDPHTGNNTSDVVSTTIVCNECSDDIDNDNDGAIDFPADVGCMSPNDNSESDEPPYAAYCGDGTINQDWEQCDGDANCTDKCQLADNNECTDLVLARVNVDNVLNEKTGNMTSDIYVGSDTNRIPAGTWFALHYNNAFITDPSVSGYKNVRGLAIERSEHNILAHHYGSLLSGKGHEHITGNIEFWQTDVTGQENNATNPLEKPSNGVKAVSAGEDEMWLDANTPEKSYFWMTVTVGNDSFNTEYGDVPTCAFLPQCSDGIDNDSDGLIDALDPGCWTDPTDPDTYDPNGPNEANGSLPQCSDGLDNDNDGKIDFPEDPGCLNGQDDDETDTPPLPQCSDGIDNDGDGKVDFPADPGCDSADDDNEFNLTVCIEQSRLVNGGFEKTVVQNYTRPTEPGRWDGNAGANRDETLGITPLNGRMWQFLSAGNPGDDVAGQPESGAGSASASNLHQIIEVPTDLPAGTRMIGEASFNRVAGTATTDTQFEVTLYPFDIEADQTATLNNNDFLNNPNKVQALLDSDDDVRTWERVTAEGTVPAGTRIIDINVSANENVLNDTTFPEFAGHFADEVCVHLVIPDPIPECSDGIDNDNDGFVDFPADPGCDDADDDDESDDPVFQCSDGIDNDGDNLVDENDPGCWTDPTDPTTYVPTDNDETNTPLPQCSDGIDNDNDGKIDFPEDPGCDDANDDDETDGPVLADLSITKNGADIVEEGGSISYVLTATNDGPGTATGVQIVDTVPTHLSFNEGLSNPNCALQSNAVVCSDFSLNPSQSKMFIVTFDVLPTAACNSVITNTASIISAAVDPDNANNESQAVQTTVECDSNVSDLTMTKTDGQSTIGRGETLTYSITVTNPTNAPVTGFEVKDTLPSQVSFLSANNGGTMSGSAVEWENLTLAAGQSVTLTLSALVNDTSSNSNGTIISNTAFIPGGTTAQDTTTVQNDEGGITIELSDSTDKVEPGETFTYTIRLTNLSSSTQNNVDVLQTLDSQTTFVSATSDGEDDDQVVEWENLTIPGNGTLILRSTVRVASNAEDGDILRSSAFTGAESDDETTMVDEDRDDDDDDDDDDNNRDDIRLSVTDNRDPVEAGETFTYTIRVTNDDDDDKDVDVRAYLDDNSSFLTASDGGRERGSDEVEWDNLNIDEDGTRTLTLTVRVRQTAERGDLLRLVVRADDEEEQEATSVIGDGDEPEGEGDVILTVDKSADRREAQPGSLISYTVTVRNQSNKSTGTFQVEDTFPPGLLTIQNPGGGSVSGNKIRWTADLGPNESRTFQYTGRASASLRHGQIIMNTVNVSGGRLDRSAQDTHEVRIIQQLPQTGVLGLDDSGSAHSFTLSDNETAAASIPLVIWTTIITIGIAAGSLAGRRFLP